MQINIVNHGWHFPIGQHKMHSIICFLFFCLYPFYLIKSLFKFGFPNFHWVFSPSSLFYQFSVFHFHVGPSISNFYILRLFPCLCSWPLLLLTISTRVYSFQSSIDFICMLNLNLYTQFSIYHVKYNMAYAFCLALFIFFHFVPYSIHILFDIF